MQFGDSETQRLLRQTARSYLAEKYPWDRLYALERGEAPLDGSDLKGFAELGWLGLLAPESAGGGELSLLEAAVVIEELGYAAVPVPLGVGNVAADLLSQAGTSGAEVQNHLESLVAGDRLYTVSEGTRRRGGPTHAGRAAPELPSASGDELNGVLPLVPFADMADFVVAPLTIDGAPAMAAVSLEGARLEPVGLLDRSSYANVAIEGAGLQHSSVLAKGSEAEELHERCDALLTALSVIELAGMMQRVLEMTSEYISNRVQFGQPIAKFQAARHRAAELLTQTETTRWTAYHALWNFQQDPTDTREIWLAKHWAIRAADRVFQVSHLLHGGVGVGTEYPLHLYTQGIVGFAVRAGTMNEMVARTLDALNLGVRSEAGP